MTRQRVRMAVIGTTGHGRRVAAHTIANSGDAVLVGGVGSAGEEASREFAAAFGLARTYPSIDALLADPEVDAVWICSPNHLHAEHGERAVALGKHVLLEKPIATTGAGADAAAAAARTAAAAGLAFRVGFQHRFRPAHRRIRELVAGGEVGELGYLRIHRFWPYPYYPDQPPLPAVWRRSEETSGGWIVNDIGTHLIDLAQWLGDAEPTLAGAAIASQKFDLPTEDSVALLLALGDAAIGVIETSNANPSPTSRIEIHGSRGWLRADDTLWGDCAIETQSGVVDRFPAIDHRVPYVGMLADFVAAVRGETAVGCTGEEAARVTRIVAEALASGRRLRRRRFAR